MLLLLLLPLPVNLSIARIFCNFYSRKPWTLENTELRHSFFSLHSDPSPVERYFIVSLLLIITHPTILLACHTGSIWWRLRHNMKEKTLTSNLRYRKSALKKIAWYHAPIIETQLQKLFEEKTSKDFTSVAYLTLSPSELKVITIISWLQSRFQSTGNDFIICDPLWFRSLVCL